MTVELSEDYDDIDLLIDTDPIKLGALCRQLRAQDAKQRALLAEALLEFEMDVVYAATIDPDSLMARIKAAL